MATFPNAGYNNPALGQALGNIASLFTPPSPQEALVAQTLQGQRDAAAAKAAALGRLTPDLQDHYLLENGDPTAISKLYQVQTALQPGSTLQDQDRMAYAGTQQAGNTIGGRMAGQQIASGSEVNVPAGVLGPNPVKLTNEAADPAPTTDNVAAAAIKTLPSDQQIAWALKRGQGGGTSVNIDTKAPSAIETGYGTAIGDDLGGVVKAAGTAPAVLQQVATLRNAVQHAGGNLTTGPFAQQILKGKQALGNLLGTTLDGVPESEVVNNIGNTLATEGLKALSSRGTQMEFANQLSVKPGLSQSPQGMLALLSLKEQAAHDDIALGQLASDPANRQNWLAAKQAYYAAHPIMSPFDPTQPFSQADVDRVTQPDAANGGAAGGLAAAPAASAPGVTASTARSPYGGPPQPMTAPAAGGLTPFNVNGETPAAPAASPPTGSNVTAAASGRSPSSAAIAHLRSDPTLRSQFDAYYGPGAAASALGQ